MANAVVLLCVEQWVTTVESVSTAESVGEGIPDHFPCVAEKSEAKKAPARQLRRTTRLRAIHGVRIVVPGRFIYIRSVKHLSRKEGVKT